MGFTRFYVDYLGDAGLRIPKRIDGDNCYDTESHTLKFSTKKDLYALYAVSRDDKTPFDVTNNVKLVRYYVNGKSETHEREHRLYTLVNFYHHAYSIPSDENAHRYMLITVPKNTSAEFTINGLDEGTKLVVHRYDYDLPPHQYTHYSAEWNVPDYREYEPRYGDQIPKQVMPVVRDTLNEEAFDDALNNLRKTLA